MENQEEDPYEQ